jgi:UDP-N-acetylmuramoyl-tripeptide--D-alanyl-D-alanine ligase
MTPLPPEVWKKLLNQTLVWGPEQAWNKVTELVIDSRKARTGALFVALEGEKTDGHLFVGQALQNGACAVLARKGREKLLAAAHLAFPEAGFAFVEEPVDFMASLSRAHLERFPNFYRVGVTGSNGKTTTKQMLAAVLARTAPTWASEGNLNSEIGLPMTSLAVDSGHRWGVFEMGINHAGEMNRLQTAVFPQLAILTNVGTAHIGMFGSREGIALEKKKIYSLGGGETVAVLPSDCDLLPLLKKDFHGRVELFGESDPDFLFLKDLGLEGCVFSWKGREIRLGIPGRHQVKNALAVAKTCEVLGVSLDALVAGLENFQTLPGRAEVVRGRVDLVVDCYNANLDSMGVLLDSVSHFDSRGRKILVLGAMKELGDQAQALHRELGKRAAQAGADEIYWLGEEAQMSYQALQLAGFQGKTAWTDDFETLQTWLKDTVNEGDLVILKGSRSMALERLLPLWKNQQEEKVLHVL